MGGRGRARRVGACLRLLRDGDAAALAARREGAKRVGRLHRLLDAAEEGLDVGETPHEPAKRKPVRKDGAR